MNEINDPLLVAIGHPGPDECWHLASVRTAVPGEDFYHTSSRGDQQVSQVLGAQGVSEGVLSGGWVRRDSTIVLSSCHSLRDVTGMIRIFGVNAVSKAFTISCVQDSRFLGGLGQHFQAPCLSAWHHPVCCREKTVIRASCSFRFKADSEALKKSYKKLIYERSASASLIFT